MFAAYINDMTEGVNSDVSLFADDVKLHRKVKRDKDYQAMYLDLNRI